VGRAGNINYETTDSIAPSVSHQAWWEVLHATGDLVAFLRNSREQAVIVVGYRGTTALSNAVIDIAATGIADGTQLGDWLSNTTLSVKNGQIILPAIQHGQAMLLEIR
jgi:hypothetical protein